MSALFTGKNLMHFDRVISTNTVLSEMLSNSEPLAEGAVIMADEQSHGRGQQGTFWESNPKQNITLSLLYRPEFLHLEQQFYLSIAISLGICAFLEEQLQTELKVKWPNDIYVGNEKIAGILIENTLMNTHLKTSIIGMGINVNQTQFQSTAKNPCSMKGISKVHYEIDSLLPSLFEHLESHYLMLRAKKFEYLKEQYLAKLYKYQEDRNYLISGKPQWAKIVGIEPSGRLQVLVDKQVKSFDTKEIEFLL